LRSNAKQHKTLNVNESGARSQRIAIDAVGRSATLVYSPGRRCRSGAGFTDVDLHEAPTIWHSSDTLVVTVDTLTGRVTGRSPGDVSVYSGGGSSAAVHVH